MPHLSRAVSRLSPRETEASVPLSVIAEHYKVQRLLGRGGMATVYQCTDQRDGKSVAVKILREDLGSAVTVERFLREIDFASELDHPQIPKVLDTGVIGALPFYAMTYIEGESLGARLKRENRLPIEDAVRIACAAIEAMTYAHARGIVHRDIKPENILLSGDDVFVLDFGVARAVIESVGEHITSTGIAVGTPAYMSPEQAMGDSDLDVRSDIYSLGCVLYEMIAGIPPFVGPTAQVVMAKRFVAPPPPLRNMRDSVPEQVDQAVGRALATVPADRWATAEEFAKALRSPIALRTGGNTCQDGIAYIIYNDVGAAGAATRVWEVNCNVAADSEEAMRAHFERSRGRLVPAGAEFVGAVIKAGTRRVD